jgi:TetR/AcrR family transcriptional repressor of mexJK operon|tara:strand:- start:334 stop:945 length:612 start_codon:yes stop_codon:yes gene_type:complete
MVNKRSKSEIKRQQILDAAIALFIEKGFAKTSMDLIAKNADVSKQTVYSHFGNKDELFFAAIEFRCESMQLFEISALDFTDVRAILIQIARRFSQFVTSKEASAVHKICAFESSTYPQVSDIFYKAGPLKITTQLANLFEALHEKDLLTIHNSWQAAIHFLNIMKGELWMQVEFNLKDKISPKDADQYLCDSVDFFIRGYSKF